MAEKVVIGNAELWHGKNSTGVDVDVRVENGEFIVIDPNGQEFRSGLVRKH